VKRLKTALPAGAPLALTSSATAPKVTIDQDEAASFGEVVTEGVRLRE
jgi:hypothetical protein